MAVLTKCKGCGKDIEGDELDRDKVPENCQDCLEKERIYETTAELISRLQDYLAENPEGILQGLVEKLKREEPISDHLGEVEKRRSDGSGDNLPGMVPQLTHPELRARELADAQDTKVIIGDRVKDRENTLRVCLEEAELRAVVVKDALGKKREFIIDDLPKIKTRKNID